VVGATAGVVVAGGRRGCRRGWWRGGRPRPGRLPRWRGWPWAALSGAGWGWRSPANPSGAADVPPAHGVLAESFPRGFLDLQPVPLGHGLLDAADEDGGGVHPLDANRLVSGEQQDALVGEFALQSRPDLSMFSQMTAANRGRAERASARRSARPPSLGRPVSACYQESECPRGAAAYAVRGGGADQGRAGGLGGGEAGQAAAGLPGGGERLGGRRGLGGRTHARVSGGWPGGGTGPGSGPARAGS
jgi:hypothetical protein